MTTSSPNRARHLAYIHEQARVFKLDPKGPDYRAWLKRRCGVESCKALDDAALARLADSLKATGPQWQRAHRLALALGFHGFDDEGFKTFMVKITKETERWHLSRQQLSNLMIAMQRWLDHKTRQPSATLAAPPAQADVGPEPLPVVGVAVDGGHKKAPAAEPRQGFSLSTSPVPTSNLEPSSVALRTLPR